MQTHLLPARDAALLSMLVLTSLPLGCGAPLANPAVHAGTVREITTEEVSYSANGVALHGFLAYPAGASAEQPVPGVLVVHEWWGQNDYARGRAWQLAEMGYAAFAIDMFGDGKVAENPEEAMAFSQEATGDDQRMAARFNAALEQLNNRSFVDSNKTAAIGYCMGGGVVLNMVRLGADLDVAASFYGSLPTSGVFADSDADTQVFVFHAGRDEYVSSEALEQFKSFMRHAPGVEDLQTRIYEDAQHSFSNPDATAYGEKFNLPLGYDEEADSASWASLDEELRRSLGMSPIDS